MEDLTDKKFGRLVVLQHIHKGYGVCVCRCDCGKIKEIRADNLISGKTKSCGCLQKEIIREKKKTHNMSDTRIYKIWDGIKKRCRPNYKLKNRYYHIGIRMCESWRNDFMSFYTWAISNGYKDDLTIDRIDNNGDYCPENCRWITISKQQFNKSNNHKINYNGKEYCVSELAEILGINKQTLFSRIYRGRPIC